MDDNITAGKRRQTQRVASLDIFRGLTVALMILVDDAGGEWPEIDHAPWHGCNLADFMMPFFLFIVGMAIPLSLKRVSRRRKAVRKVIFSTLKLFFLGLLLQGRFSPAPDKLTCEVDTKMNKFSGILQRIVFGVDMKTMRLCGILQRIAFSYLLVAILEIFLKDAARLVLSHGHFSVFKSYCWQWAMGVFSLIVYFGFVYGIYVPDWHFTIHNKDSADHGKLFNVTCRVRGKLNPPCNAVGLIDRSVLGINHMYQHPAWRRSKDCPKNATYEDTFKNDVPSWCHAPFEPEGILSSISSLLSTIIGAHFGHVLIHLKISFMLLGSKSTFQALSFTSLINLHFQCRSDRLKHRVIMGLFLLVLGLILHFTHAIPLNRQLYTFSYVCVTSGAAALVFSTIYILVDIRNLKHVFLPLKWIGMNALLIYVLAAEGIFAGFINGWYYEDRRNTLIYWIKKHIFIGVWHSQRVGVLLYVIFAEILFWAAVSGILHWLGIYWKL